MEPKEYPILPPFSYRQKKAATLLEQWVKGQVVRLSHVDRFSSMVDQKAANFCPYHRRRGHPLEQCVVFRRLLDENLKAGEILFQEGGTANVQLIAFLKASRRRKRII